MRGVDNLATGNRKNIAEILDRIDFREADILDLNAMHDAFKGVDYVFHEAAVPSVPKSVLDPIGSNRANIDGTVNVLVAARDAGVKRTIFAGSAAVYGDNPVLPRAESQEPQPLSPYALTKLAGEQYCRIFTRVFGHEAVALRFFNIFGPRQNPHSPYTGVLSKFIVAYLRGDTPVIFGDGEQSRDFTYVANVVDAVLRACSAYPRIRPGRQPAPPLGRARRRIRLAHLQPRHHCRLQRQRRDRRQQPRPSGRPHSHRRCAGELP